MSKAKQVELYGGYASINVSLGVDQEILVELQNCRFAEGLLPGDHIIVTWRGKLFEPYCTVYDGAYPPQFDELVGVSKVEVGELLSIKVTSQDCRIRYVPYCPV